jgi:hypothetical protein
LQPNPPAAPAVRDLLDRVLRSETFARSERARKLLRYLVEREQEGDAERLKGFSIAMDVFGKDSDFDPSTDAVVRVQAGRLRELLSHYYEVEGANDPIRVSIPRGGYIPTYQSIAKEPEEQPTEAAAVPAGAIRANPLVIGQVRLFWSAMAVVIAMLGFVVFRMVTPAQDQAPDAAIAAETQIATAAIDSSVATEALPTVFVRAAPDSPEAGRVAGHFRMALAGFDTVDLIGREPDAASGGSALAFAFAFADGPEPGSVTIDVSSVASGRVLLTRSLGPSDLDGTHIDARVADILSSVVPVTGVIYGYLEQTAKVSPLIRCLLLNDRYYLNPGPEAHKAAYTCLETLVAADARSPLVYSELASLHLEAFTDRYPHPAGSSETGAMELALRAVKMGPTSPYAHRAMGYVTSRTGKRVESIRWMKKAYELNICDLSMAASYAYALIFSGNYTEGAPIMERAVEAASAHPSWWDYGLFLAKMMQGDMERASAATNALAATKRSHYLAARLISATFHGDTVAAGVLSSEISQSYPKFAADPRATFEAANYPADLTDKLVSVLRAAGLGGAS